MTLISPRPSFVTRVRASICAKSLTSVPFSRAPRDDDDDDIDDGDPPHGGREQFGKLEGEKIDEQYSRGVRGGGGESRV